MIGKKFLAFFYSQCMKLRADLYRKNIFPVQRVSCPVISVGNITMGGTGKTPIVSYLLSLFLEQNIKPGVVSRGYKGRYSGVACVKFPDPDLFGDEPSMLKKWHSNIPIYLSRKRVNACRELLQKESVDVIVLDDGFQHRGLYRDIDIVVLDALEPLENYCVVPQGRARESLEALKEADCVIVNKVNLASSGLDSLLEQIKKYTQSPIIQSEYTAQDLRPLDVNGENLSKPQKALLVSGIGHPESFERLVATQGIEIKGHLKYPDHFCFKVSDIKKARRTLESVAAESIIVTDKDAIKISHITKDLDPIWSLSLGIFLDSNWEPVKKRILSQCAKTCQKG